MSDSLDSQNGGCLTKRTEVLNLQKQKKERKKNPHTYTPTLITEWVVRSYKKVKICLCWLLRGRPWHGNDAHWGVFSLSCCARAIQLCLQSLLKQVLAPRWEQRKGNKNRFYRNAEFYGKSANWCGSWWLDKRETQVTTFTATSCYYLKHHKCRNLSRAASSEL